MTVGSLLAIASLACVEGLQAVARQQDLLGVTLLAAAGAAAWTVTRLVDTETST